MKDAIVYMRHVQWEVVVPLGLEWEFMKSFGEAFRLNDAMEMTNSIRPVDGYYEHRNGWHIKVSVNEIDEQRLLRFCKDFFGSRDIPFREPEMPAHPWTLGFLRMLKKDIVITLKNGENCKGTVRSATLHSVSMYVPAVGHVVDIEFDDIYEVVEEAQLIRG